MQQGKLKLSDIHAMLASVAVRGLDIQNACHDLAVNAGWWHCPETGEVSTVEYVHRTMVPQKLLLIHSEVSEACEGHRKGLKDTHLPNRDMLEVELADAAIRIFDLAGALGYDLGAAMAEKLAYNTQRKDHTIEARKSLGGKTY